MRLITMFFLSFTLFQAVSLVAQQTPVKVSKVVIENKAAKRMITGSLMNTNVSKMASQEAGLVLKAEFRQGDIVKKGTVLYVLDDRDLQLELEQAKVNLIKANSVFEQKKIALEFSEKELSRRKKAQETTPGIISEQDLASYQNEFMLAREVLNLSKIEKDLCEIKIKNINKHLQDMVIKAPFDGLLRVKNKEIGEWVNKGDMVAVLVGLDSYEAHFEIPQSISLESLIKIKEVEVTIEGASKTYVASRFNFIAGVNENSRNYTVAGLIDGPSLDLISGKTLSTYIPLGAEKSLVRINSNAILKDPAGYFVYKVTAMDEKTTVAMQVPISVDFIEGKYHFCTSATLQTGDKIVTEGNERLRPMAPIMVIGENE